MRPISLISVAAVAAVLAAGCTKKEAPISQAPPIPPGPNAAGPPGGPPMPPGQASPAAAGKVVFTSYCQGCHGVKGEGKVPGTPVFSAAWQKKEASDAPLLAAITNGKGRMPAYKTRLSEQQVKDVLAYVRTLGK